MKKQSDDPRRHVFRYDQHMPHTDDLSLVVLKGHLLVEEMLKELTSTLLPNANHLEDARLSFHQLARVVRSAAPTKSNDKCWELILALNSVRNNLVHNLESPKLKSQLRVLFALAERVQPTQGVTIDKSGYAALGEAELLRQSVVDCMQFLRGFMLKSKKRKKRKAA